MSLDEGHSNIKSDMQGNSNEVGIFGLHLSSLGPYISEPVTHIRPAYPTVARLCIMPTVW